MKTDEKSQPEDEVTKAARILAEDQARRMEACMQEIQAILDTYGFDLAVSNPSVSLVPKK